MSFKQNYLIHVITLLCGILLLVSAANSIVQSFVRGFEPTDYFSLPVNLVVGGLLVVSGSLRPVRVLGFLLFAIYCFYLGSKVYYGGQTCNCFGAGTSAKLMLAIDCCSAISLGLLAFRFGYGEPKNSEAGFSYSTYTLLIGMLLVGSVSVGVWLQSKAPLRVLATIPVSNLSRSSEGKTLELEISNSSPAAIRVYGIEKNCQLYPSSEFPIDLQPGQSGKVRVCLRREGLGASMQYSDRGTIKMFVSDESKSFSCLYTLSATWFLSKFELR